MTDLQLAICEAEQNGEIDLETRNEMLSIIETAQEFERELQEAADDSLDRSDINTIKSIIYERELNGEISPEERAFLIERFEIQYEDVL